MHKIRVGVLRGGPSREYESSLKTGSNVLNNLPADKYISRDILIDKNGNWFVHGLPTTPHEALTHIDVAFNALHGHFGEDGKIQHMFEVHGIPYTGSGSFASALGMNKDLTKQVYRKEGIKTPQSVLLDTLSDISKEAHKIFKSFPLPVVVKPIYGGSSHGISIVKDVKGLDEAIQKALEFSDTVMVEEYISGKEATCMVVDGYRDQEYYATPPVEIRPGFDALVPGNFFESEKREIEQLSVIAHKILGLRHYSRSDFIIHPKRGVFILETNTLPKLTEKSLMPTALKSVGASVSHFLDHIIQLAISGK